MHVNVTPVTVGFMYRQLFTATHYSSLCAVPLSHETRSWPCSLQKASLEMLFRETH